MIQILSAWKWISAHLKTFLFILLIALSVAIYWLWQNNRALKVDNSRISENFEQKDKQVSQLNLTIEEFKDLDTDSKKKIDSLLTLINKKPKNIKQATDIQIQYIDTGSTKIVYRDPVKLPDSSYLIPVSFDSDCWGFKGQISSKDQSSKLDIIEKSFNNSAQILIVKKKKFLWWTIRKESIRAFSGCGEISVTQINFVKK